MTSWPGVSRARDELLRSRDAFRAWWRLRCTVGLSWADLAEAACCGLLRLRSTAASTGQAKAKLTNAQITKTLMYFIDSTPNFQTRRRWLGSTYRAQLWPLLANTRDFLAVARTFCSLCTMGKRGLRPLRDA